MNYLFHLYLSDRTSEGLLGNLMGDFVKGRLDLRYEAGIRQGIMLHRKVDSFAATHAVIRRSRNRIDPSYRHYRGILVDIFYDHFLALNWDRYSDIPLNRFARHVYQTLEEHQALLPEGLQRVSARMISHNWLESYRQVDTVGIVLERMSGRLSRPNPLASGIDELHRHYSGLEADFEEFLPEAKNFVRVLTEGTKTP